MQADWSEARQAFVQHSKTDVLDSSLLHMTSVGYISPTDPMWTSTLDAMEGELVTDSLVDRYDPAASPRWAPVVRRDLSRCAPSPTSIRSRELANSRRLATPSRRC